MKLKEYFGKKYEIFAYFLTFQIVEWCNFFYGYGKFDL